MTTSETGPGQIFGALPLADEEAEARLRARDAVLATLAGAVSPRILRAPARLDEVSRQLEEYFAGRRRVFDVPLDLRLARGFRRSVLAHLPAIGYGQTESYAQVAAAAGRPRAVRAAGTACATNPLPVIVPCHRVIRSDGTPGLYVGGPEAKRSLLTLEAAA
jgi:methylated-DNA-[protein]-cysteine S-methyltransferase